MPEVTIEGASKQFVVIGNDVQLTCYYNTSPPPSEVLWKKDGTVITRNATTKNGARGNITHFNESLVQTNLVPVPPALLSMELQMKKVHNYIVQVTWK